MTDTLAQTRPQWRRWLRRLAIALLMLVLAAAGGVWWVSRNLNTGWVKHRLRRITGLELDYTDAKLRILSGIHLEGLTVASPAAWRDLEPLLLRAGGLDLGWTLFSKSGTLQTVLAEDVEITIVVDEHGHSSLEGLTGTPPAQAPPPEPPPTPGHLPTHLLESLPSFAHIALTRANLTVLRTKEHRVIDRTRLTGLSLDAQSTGGIEAHGVRLVVGSKRAPEKLALLWHGEGAAAGEATGKAWLDAELEPGRTEVHGEIVYDQQSLSKDWPKKATLLAIDTKARAEHDKLAVELDRFELIDQSLTAKGAIDVEPGRAHVLTAQGKIDLDRLIHWAPKGLVPVELHEGRARYDVALLEVSASPSLDPKGRLEIDGVLSGVRLSGSTALSLDQAKLEVRGKPTAHGGLHLTADLPAGTLHVEEAGTRGNLSGVHLSANATFAPGERGQVEARVRFASLSGDGPPGQMSSSLGDVTLKLAELAIDPKAPKELDGAVQLAAALGTFDAKRPEARTHASDVRLDLHTRIAKGVPGAIELTLPLGSVEVASRTETVLPAGPAKVTARIDHIKLDRDDPSRTAIDGHLDVGVGPITASAGFQKHADTVDFDLSLDAKRTSLLTVWAPESLELPGARMAMKLGVKGRADANKLRADVTLHLDRPAITLAEETLSATQLDATASIDGSLRRQTLSLTLEPQSLSLDDEQLGSGKLSAQASWDLQRPSLEVHLDGRGDALPSGKLALTASLDKKTRALKYAIDGDLGHLAALEPLLPEALSDDHWIDLSDLHARVKSEGTLTGLVRGVDKQGVPQLLPHPLTELSGDDQLSLTLDQVHYVDVSGVELTVPRLELNGTVHAVGQHRTAELSAHLPKTTLVVGDHRLDLTELHDQVKLDATGDPRAGEIDATHTLSIGRLGQDWLAAYPIADLRWSGRARRGPDGTLHVDEVVLDNRGGGTHLTLSGSLILPRTNSVEKRASKSVPLVGFRSMTLSLALDQELGPLSGDPKHFRGDGRVLLQADVASGDLHRFHVVSSTRFDKATIELPEKRLLFAGLNGSLPVVQDVHVDNKQVSLAEVRETNAYPTVRFSDQHPFLSGASGLTAQTISVGDLTFTRVAANLRLSRNLFAVDQLEAEVRGGRIGGQCLLTLKGGKSTAQLRLRLTGIEALHGGAKERFDGNAALAFSMADRTVEGRAEILRIGRHHLFDLLDAYDPHHSDPPTNRVRTALALGYPDHVRVLFERGFASYSITFGGLARLVKVADVHGIPTGPLIDRYLGPLFALEGAP